MTAFTLKIIALVSMFADHSAAVFPQHFPIEFRAFGRLAYPIFVYLFAEGFRHTKSPGKFMLRLFALAVISQIPYSLAFAWATRQEYVRWAQAINFTSDTNIFYTLFLGASAIVLYNRFKTSGRTSAVYIGAVLPPAILAELLSSDYGGLGVLFIFCMYAITEKQLRLVAMSIFSIAQFWPILFHFAGATSGYGFEFRPEYFLMPVFALFAVGLISLYNGKRGRDMKWLFYAAYPTHLVVLTIAAIIAATIS